MIRIFFILSLLVLSACDEHHYASSPLKIATNQWPGYEPLYLAQQLGFHDKRRIKMIELTSATEVMNAFNLDKVDVAALTLDEVLLLAQRHNDLAIFLVMDISNGADQLIVDQNIQSLTDIKNKRIGVEQTALGAYFLSLILKQAGLKQQDVEVIPVTVNKHFEMMSTQQLDAVITFEPSATRLTSEGFKTLFDSSQTPGEIVDVLVARKGNIEKRPDDYQHLIESHWKSLDYINRHSESAMNLMAPRLHISSEQLIASYQGLVLPNKQMNQSLLGQPLNETIDSVSNIMQQQGMLNSAIDSKNLIDPSVVQ
jgi:NitT/TauT family transport system substrate-binding protein